MSLGNLRRDINWPTWKPEEKSITGKILLKKISYYNIQLGLKLIGSSLGIDWEFIWSGVEWSGPAIRPGLDNRHLIILTPHTCL